MFVRPFFCLIITSGRQLKIRCEWGGWSIHWRGTTKNDRGATTIFDAINAVSSAVDYVGGVGDTDELWQTEAHVSLITSCKGLRKKD